MYLEIGNTISPIKRLVTKMYKPLFWLSILSIVVSSLAASPVYAANPISYSLSPASGSYDSGANVPVLLSIKTTTAIAGASVNLGLTNAALASFNTANSSAFILVDYHEDQGDIVVICQNNNCPPGTYPIATLNLTAGQPGSMQVNLKHVEAADPNLQPLAADGAQYTYAVNQSASGSNGSGSSVPKKSTYTVPKTGSGPAIIPNEVTEDELTVQENEAAFAPANGANSGSKAPDNKENSGSTLKNLLYLGGILVLAGVSFIAGRKFRGPSAAPNSMGYGSVQSSKTIDTGPLSATPRRSDDDPGGPTLITPQTGS